MRKNYHQTTKSDSDTKGAETDRGHAYTLGKTTCVVWSLGSRSIYIRQMVNCRSAFVSDCRVGFVRSASRTNIKRRWIVRSHRTRSLVRLASIETRVLYEIFNYTHSTNSWNETLMWTVDTVRARNNARERCLQVIEKWLFTVVMVECDKRNVKRTRVGQARIQRGVKEAFVSPPPNRLSVLYYLFLFLPLYWINRISTTSFCLYAWFYLSVNSVRKWFSSSINKYYCTSIFFPL